MSDPVENFECIFKKNARKHRFSLYSDNKQQNKHTIKPQDVITSVSLQLKAIQVADSLKSEKSIVNNLQKFKKSNFLSVNNLPMYEEVPKTTTKFDTQCVSDTQLINIIEDAEIIDVHRGMTQEFETSFIHHTEKQSTVNDEKRNVDVIIEDNEEVTKKIQTVNNDKVAKEAINAKEGMDKIHENNTETISVKYYTKNNMETDTSVSLISPIMCSNNVIDNGISNTDNNTQDSKKDENTQVEEFSEMFNECIEIENDTDMLLERPLSPIFMHKNLKMKSKTLSPLIFNLDRFEQFEKIVIPILEGNDLKTAKQVINSQIIDKELHINMDQEIFLNKRHTLSPALMNKDVKEAYSSEAEFKTHIVKDPNIDTDLEFIELDKASSDDIINKITNEDSKSLKVTGESEILKDEILFSSDEEDYVQKSYQDLPFTCALETSFYDQPDVLDKTMYVGFQTASNKSIQIFTESFNEAKSILSGITWEEVTVTDLVKNCNSSVKNTIDVGETEAKMALDDEEIEINLGQKNNNGPDLQFDRNEVEEAWDIPPNNKTSETSNFEGFMTASKKIIKLSQKALARCRKVFHEIDLNENFDTQTEDVIAENECCKDILPAVTDTPTNEANKDFSDDEDIQNIDDVIIQEFENIEMSLKEDKEPDENVPNITFKDIQMSETGLTKLKDVFKDIDIEDDLSDLGVRKTNIEEKQNLIEFEQPFKGKPHFLGFKTANNKNIKISEEALVKTKNIFKDIGSTQFPKAKKTNIQENSSEENIYDQLSTFKGFVGFKTANNKNINISKDAFAKTMKIFDGIDSADLKLPTKKNTDVSTESNIEKYEGFIDLHQSSTSKSSFVGIKTASCNKKISDDAFAKTAHISKDFTDFKYPEKEKKIEGEKIYDVETKATAITITKPSLATTKNIFKDFDDLKFPSKLKENNEQRIIVDNDNIHEVELIDLNMLSSSTASFVGFKTANNKKISISEEALIKTKNIFKYIDAVDFKLPEKRARGMETDDLVKDTQKTDEKKMLLELEDLGKPTSKASFIGFKTANNRNITISKESLAKTENIFKDIDTTDFKVSEKVNKDLNNVDFTETKNNEREGKNVFESEIIDLNQHSTSKAGFIGFKTANNMKIHISEESLSKTKNIFTNIDSNDFAYPKKPNAELQERAKEGKSPYPDLKESVQPPTSKASFVGTETTAAKTKNILKDIDSTKSLDKEKQNLVDYEQPSTSKAGFIGFKTASNKKIEISEQGLAKSKNIFKDVDAIEFQIPEKNKDDYPNIEIEDEEANIISKETGPIISRNNDVNKISDTTGPKFRGFQTASNKQVKVSAEALVKSRKIFKDLSEDFNIENKQIEERYVPDTVKDDPEDFIMGDLDINGKLSPVFRGFQTANKKPVTVSTEALVKSKKLFQDIETIEDDPEPEFHGFKTANDEEVKVSQKALTETKKLFENAIKGTSFKGFQTASDKNVVISEDFLAKSRKMFHDIEKNENLLQNNEKRTSNIKFGFKTGANRDITVSEKDVARSKRLFSEIDNSNQNITNNTINEDNVINIIDTQILNNFDESLHTEDFHNSSIKSKRSGSPILLCPRAKKRKKFETPYSQKVLKPVKKKDIIKTEDINKITFTEDYKQNKKNTLKDLAELTKDNITQIDPYLLKFCFDNLLQFEFTESRNGLSNGKMTIDVLKELFMNSVNSKLIPNGWLDNHLKLILWKLISYEIKFKSFVVNVKNVMDQLKYRYDKELYNAQRPALRKILEKDDVPSKTMVLCVAAVYIDGVGVASATTTNNMELLITDGWYCIKASIDKMLAQLVCQGKIVVGSKIVTNGAELVNCEQGISPWEDSSAVRLKLYGNSTRRARWDARLGYHGNSAILSQLSSVKLDGGKVSKLRVFVTRVYPALYVEKFEDGSTVTRSERLEHLHQMKSEAERQAIMEKIYEEVEKEFSNHESQDSEGPSELSNKRSCLDSGSQIAKLMKRSKDPGEFRAGLTSSQTRLLENYTTKRREVLLQDIQQKIRDKMENAGVINRNVVMLLKIRVAGVTGRTGVEITKGMMSIWKPTDAVLEIIKEGAWIDVMNVVPTAVRYSEIQISAGRQTVFSISKYKEPEKFKPYTKLLKRSCFTIKDLAQNPSISTDYNEIDTVGFIFLIDPSIREFDSTKQPFQNVFLADADKNLVCINFWGGLKKFGFQNVLDTGQIVACANLQKRAGNTRKSIPQYRVTEFSYFTKTPKNENARILIDDLSKKFLSLDRRKFCEDCVVLKNNYAVIKHNNENISPYRFYNSDYNISKNKMFIDSPLASSNKIDDNFNLTGLDFESTFKQTDTQNLPEEVLLRKKKVNEKIARLKMYGEPPPLSTIHIINKSKNASNSYKSPLSANNNSKMITQKSKSESAKPNTISDSSVSVASVEETPEKCGNLNDTDVVCSPVLMNRTYVKSFNPVKINFDVKDNNDSNIDHFAEDFDGSPPLSLD